VRAATVLVQASGPCYNRSGVYLERSELHGWGCSCHAGLRVARTQLGGEHSRGAEAAQRSGGVFRALSPTALGTGWG
jgi:hypothetical protein